MFDWLTQHAQILNTLTNVGMLLVWSAYLHLILVSFRRQRRPMILVNRGGGRGLDARCLISNMSEEAIYIESIVAALETPEERLSSAVTDLEDLENEQLRTDPRQSTRQGPLASGNYMDVGTYRGLVERVLRDNGRDGTVRTEALADRAVLEVCVIANYGSEILLVGGKRVFDLLAADHGLKVQPQGLDTEQITSRRERRQLAQMLRDFS